MLDSTGVLSISERRSENIESRGQDYGAENSIYYRRGDGHGRTQGTDACQSRGWKVFAGVLPGADTSELGEHENIVPVEQDVSSDESVKASAAVVEKELAGAPLDLLINNAGVADLASGVMEGVSIENGKRLFEINTWGTLRVCQEFLPMVRRGAPHSRSYKFCFRCGESQPAGIGHL